MQGPQDTILAVEGGRPARSKQWKDNFTTSWIEGLASLKAVSSGYLSKFEGAHSAKPPFSFFGGPQVLDLEKRWASGLEIGHCVSVNSATSGLYAAIGALNVGFGDEVIVSPYTMAACATAPLVYGAIPVFADVDPRTGCLDPASVAANVTNKTKAIIVVHQFGFPAEMDKIMAIARENSLAVIEDCAQAWQTTFQGQAVGTFGDIGVFSLNVNKAIQSGEGGLCVTRDPNLAYRMQLIRNHGEAVVGPAEYEEIENIVGFNYRMTEVTAAIAISQLAKLERLVQKRLFLVSSFLEGVSKFDWINPLQPVCSKCNGRDSECCRSGYYLVPFTLKPEIDRDHFVQAMLGEGVPVGAGYVRPLYFQPMFQKKVAFKANYPFAAPVNTECKQKYQEGTAPVAEHLNSNSLCTLSVLRHPHRLRDVQDLILAVRKYDSWLQKANN